jgi:hypothetical protein
MLLPEWRDITIYSQSDTEHVVRTVRIEIGKFHINVTRHTNYDPDVWILSWSLGMFPLRATELEQAKIEALRKVDNYLFNAGKMIKEIIKE